MMRQRAIFGSVMAAAAMLLALVAPPLLMPPLIVNARAAAPPAAPHPVTARLIAETHAVEPGKTLWVDLHLDIAKGWHTYWRNPGDSGLPTEIAWQLPPGFRAGHIEWPVPQRIVVGTIGNYGYRGAADLLVPISTPSGLSPGGTVRLAAQARWLVCSEICIPGDADLSLTLPVTGPVAGGPVAGDPAVAARFAAIRAKLPQKAPFATRFAATAHAVRLFVPQAALKGLDRPKLAFFPSDSNVVNAAADVTVARRGGGVVLTLARNTGPTARLPTSLDGVLTLGDGEGGGAERAYAITAPRGSVPEPAAGGGAAGIWWGEALVLAFLGGVILNLMPCVFPILSLKVLGLTVSVHRAEERRHGLAYGAGAVLSFAALGGVLLLLRAGGAAIGWGFQLQSPVVVALLAYLLLAMGLSLSGVAEFGVGLGGIGSRFAGRAGLLGAFATGVLATVVATPCSAPFMGAALGFALVAPAALALGVFVAVGMGLAAPIVLVSAIPALSRLLPQPGPWMGWFKQLLAFPLYGTVAWLLWVLIQEIGSGSAFVALLGPVAVGFAVWLYGRSRDAGPLGRRLGGVLAGAAAVLAIIVAVSLTPLAGPADRTAAAAPGGGLGYEAFSTARLARLTAEHRPVFVNLTAAWCITCLVNERATLDSAAVRRAFAAHHVVALKGDWTRQDPAITAFLQRYGRSGVPLYLLYNKAGQPTVLPQILSEETLLRAVGKI